MREGLQDSLASHRSGEEIQVTGFLVPTKNGKWCLAETPAAKSCCLDRGAVFVLLSDFLWEGPPPRRPVRLLGELVNTADGPTLQNVERVSDTSSSPDWGSVFLVCWIAVGFWVYKKI